MLFGISKHNRITKFHVRIKCWGRNVHSLSAKIVTICMNLKGLGAKNLGPNIIASLSYWKRPLPLFDSIIVKANDDDANKM